MSDSTVLEWLRPFVEAKAWDFVVVWKYGDDPTSFIEWLGCCCSGSCGESIEDAKKLKDEEMDEKQNDIDSSSICKDAHFQHPIRTKACKALYQLPFAMSLYSGVHGEVAISQQPKWLTHGEEIGTQVLIPVVGGLVELFTTKLVPKDNNILEFIRAHCYVSLKQEAICAQHHTDVNFSENLSSEEQYTQSSPQLASTLTDGVHLLAANWCKSYPYIEEPSSGSNPSSEYTSFDSKFVCLTHHEYLGESVKLSPTCKTERPKYNETSGKQQGTLSSYCGNGKRNKTKSVRVPPKEGYHAKNLATERRRRNKIKNGLFTLRSLVPKITKMDRASILADAIDYIKELHGQVEDLKDEVRNLEVEDCEKNTPQSILPTSKEQGENRTLLAELNQSSSNSTKQIEMKMQTEVNHISRTEFLLKVCWEQKPGGFSRLMEAINSFGFQVETANMTTIDGKAQIILTVEAAKDGIHPTKLKDFLKEQTG
ncbi:transcription factor bHLH90 isoform X1 [Arachis stenosperma]|uniref:transcription factor bHLH90 isoform X1 n=2 Tax=Arachis stenosperma TaxID=217475 RepID=UPI0025AB7479|nr:transcription factor bHLH90 isoform X1 [Arachis stenosperma]